MTLQLDISLLSQQVLIILIIQNSTESFIIIIIIIIIIINCNRSFPLLTLDVDVMMEASRVS
jgi:hypothetical protein